MVNPTTQLSTSATATTEKRQQNLVRKPMATLIDLLSVRYAPIQSTLLQYLGPAEIEALRRSAPQFGHLWSTLLATKMNVNCHLRRFFSSPVEFRSIQGKSEALIGGDFARKFFDPRTTMTQHLEIFTYVDYKTLLGRYLQKEGYRLFRIEQHGQMLIFFKANSYDRGLEVVVHLCLNDGSAVAALLEEATTTDELCLISWNKGYTLLPHQTFLKCKIYITKPMDANVFRRLQFLTKGGHVSVFVDARESRSLFVNDPLAGTRKIGDSSTWVVELDTTNVDRPATADSVIEDTTFELAHIRAREIRGLVFLYPHYQIRFHDIYQRNAWLMNVAKKIAFWSICWALVTAIVFSFNNIWRS